MIGLPGSEAGPGSRTRLSWVIGPDFRPVPVAEAAGRLQLHYTFLSVAQMRSDDDAAAAATGAASPSAEDAGGLGP